MEKYTKHIVLVAFLVLSSQLLAQQVQNKPNNERTLKAYATEIEIQEFIEANINKYELTTEKAAAIRKSFDEHEHEHSHGENDTDELPKVLLAVKKAELRKLYFKQNPEQEDNFQVFNHIENLPLICENGDFENGITDEYVFRTNSASNVLYSCDMDTDYLAGTAPAPDTFNSTTNVITLVNNDPTVNGGNDARLFNLPTPVAVPRVNPTTGNTTAIKLNNDTASYSVTSMSKEFTVNSNIVSYSFSLIVENPNPSTHPSVDQPHFIVRIYNAEGVKVSQNCIVADVNNTELFFNAGNSQPDSPILYTGWQCGIISLDDLQIGEQARIEFTITDCGFGGHYGTVYIDDICTSEDCKTKYGEAQLYVNPDTNCPVLPLQVCGTFAPPQSITNPNVVGTLDNIVLNILQNDVVVSTIQNPVITGNEFCFPVSGVDFIIAPATAPDGDYEYQAIATFNIGNSVVIKEDTSSNAEADVSFNNCLPSPPCIDYLTIATEVTAPNVDMQQANIQIIAHNVIDANASALYHAGQEIILQPGFEALLNSEDRFYIEGCRDDNQYYERKPADAAETGNNNVIRKERQIDLVEVQGAQLQNTVTLYPNPAKSSINITAGNTGIKSVRITSLDGKQIENLNFNTGVQNVYTINISGISKGIYILTTETLDGQIISHKVIKE